VALALRMVGPMALVAMLVGACGSSPAASAVSPSPTPATPASIVATGVSSAPSGNATNQLTNRCSDNSPCTLSAGTWTTVGESSFIPGLSITVPDGWSSHEADALELKLIPLDHPDDAIFFWKDVVAIESNGETPKVLTGVPGTPEGLTASFRQNPDFVVSTPTKTKIAGDVPALTYTLGVSPSAAYTSHGCPSYPTCANILKDPVHGGSYFYAIGAPEVVRLYLATVGTGTNKHTLVISLDATDPVELKRLTLVAAPLISSVRLPAVIGDQ
jgi:hypothetical protein